ncbi:MAG: TerB family tellurite resistance protein [Rubritepida sp.]|nr:TerB family tellurite resistance protein [Rubritepida sp.]MCU0944944.1 TerB family tellurite resistance protein [Rubritepida sp.]
MGFWGKIIGGIAGFATGGPLGAVIGAAAGHAADSGALRRRIGPDAAGLAALLGSKEQLFAISVVVLSAKLAKCDGPVVRAEIDAFKRLFRIPPENMKDVAELFDQARESADGFEPFADRMGEAFSDNRVLLEDVLGALFQIARADGALTRGEVRFLQRVQVGFGLNETAWERARDGRAQGSASEAGFDAYAVLGIPANASDEEVRAAWRRLMRENHPDALAARGVPAEFIQRATNKVAEINAAWDRIKRDRKL